MNEPSVVLNAACHFPTDGEPVSVEAHGSGHINNTYLLTTTTGHRYIFQRIGDVFDVDALMKNVSSVTAFVEKRTSDPRGCMHLISDIDGNSYYEDESGKYRLFEFVEDSVCLQLPEKPEDFYQSALAFGGFIGMLSDFPVETLYEPIPNFHNTIDRYRIFHETCDADPCRLAETVKEEIEFVLKREDEAGVLENMKQNGELPLRVTHNDTKLNNVMLDVNTHKALCVIDLDTVMPGLSLYDYGDSIRFGAATAVEDEKDLDKVTIDLELFRVFTRGFLEACDLTEKEIEMLPMGAKIMTLECGLRFLTDHIDGDHYFHINRPGQNLDRARTQFKMVSEMEKYWDEMAKIVKEEADLIKKAV